MNVQDREKFFEEFNNGLHRLGRFTLIAGIIVLMAVPFLFGVIVGVMPDMPAFVKGWINVAVVYFPVSVVEFLVYAPMLGAGGSYLAFITGNVTNMKIPCAMNARDIAKTEVGTPENEIVSTISVAVSAIVTTLVILVGTETVVLHIHCNSTRCDSNGVCQQCNQKFTFQRYFKKHNLWLNVDFW